MSLNKERCKSADGSWAVKRRCGSGLQQRDA